MRERCVWGSDSARRTNAPGSAVLLVAGVLQKPLFGSRGTFGRAGRSVPAVSDTTRPGSTDLLAIHATLAAKISRQVSNKGPHLHISDESSGSFAACRTARQRLRTPRATRAATGYRLDARTRVRRHTTCYDPALLVLETSGRPTNYQAPIDRHPELPRFPDIMFTEKNIQPNRLPTVCKWLRRR